MNGTTGTQLGPSHPHTADRHPWAHQDAPAASIPLSPHPGDPALVPAASRRANGRGQRATHAMLFRYTKSSRAEQRVAPSPALVTFTGTPAEAGREDGQDQPVSGSPPEHHPAGVK